VIRVHRPAFLDSSYFVNEAGNWHLTDDAPLGLRLEFIAFMRETEPKCERKSPPKKNYREKTRSTLDTKKSTETMYNDSFIFVITPL
jgi:hypothetical protein